MDQGIFAPKPSELHGVWDVAIIGSGPAGLTAGIYTTRGAVSTIIFGGEVWGGQLMLTSNVDNFPSQPGILGADLISKMREHATMFGAEFLTKNVGDVKIDSSPFSLISEGDTYTARSIIVATGAETVWLMAPGVKELIGRGISSCAPCDAPFFKDKRVAVVGGGDSAMEEALVLTKYASEVTIVHRKNEFRASKIMQQKVLNNPKIKVMWNTEVIEAVGSQKLEKLKLNNNATGELTELIVDGLFIAIGHKPQSKIFDTKLELDEKGFIKKFEKDGFKMATNVPGIFVAGDVHDHHYKQAITAAGFGCMAAMDILKYLDRG